jgi:hypothetical protein
VRPGRAGGPLMISRGFVGGLARQHSESRERRRRSSRRPGIGGATLQP